MQASDVTGSTVAEFMKSTKTLFGAICLGATMASIVIFYISGDQEQEPDMLFVYAGIAVAFLSGFLSMFIFRGRMLDAAARPTLGEKLGAYRMALILMLAVLEFSILLNLVLYFLSGHMANFLIAVAMVIVMVSRFPSKSSIGLTLSLSDHEYQRFMKDDTVI